MNDRSLYFRLLTYVKPYWKRLVISAFLLALLAASEPLFPALMKPLIDEGFTNHNEKYIQWIPIALVGLFLFRGILTFTSTYISAWVANRVVADLRGEMFQHMVHLPVTYFDSQSSGSLASHIAHDAGNVAGAAPSALTVITRDSLTLAALIGWLLWLDWKLTMITLAMFPFIIMVVRYFNRRLRNVSSANQNAMATLTHTIEEAASNNRIVKIFTAEQYEIKRFRSTNEHQRGLAMRATVAHSALTPIVHLLASLSVAIIIAVALHQSNNATATAGGFMSFLTALLMLLPPIKRLTDITSIIQRGLAAAEMVFSIIDKPAEQNHSSLINSHISKGRVEFKEVGFHYPDTNRKVLEQFSLTIPEGKNIALVGHSGSGKTTITSLLSGFYPITEGRIFLDGINFMELDLNEIRHNISLVSQDIRLFNNTILCNVTYGEESPNRQLANKALEMANALRFVEELPKGLDTLVGQNGVRLSGGQRQRIAIARAFYRDAPILILDEATSALDTESERNIQNALKKLMKNRTTIMIAHRLSTIEDADQIIVMEEGKIVEQGAHDELLSLKGLYAHYYELQFSETDKL